MKFSLHFYLDSPYDSIYKHAFFTQYSNAVCGDKNPIFLCDHDKDIQHLRCKKSGPVIAVSHASNTNQELMGTPWLLLSPDALTPDFLEEVYHRFYHLPLVIARTPRCFLREFHIGDLDSLLLLQQENRENPEGCFFPSDCQYPEQFLSDYIHHQYPFFGYGLYAVIEKTSNILIGIVGFSNVFDKDTSSAHLVAEISYSLLKRWQHQGFAKEMITALLDRNKKTGEFQEIIAQIRPSNTASCLLAKKCGIPIHYLDSFFIT